jgi:hypothetical protein
LQQSRVIRDCCINTHNNALTRLHFDAAGGIIWRVDATRRTLPEAVPVCIDLSTETPVPLSDVRLPGRDGKPIHFSTVFRWVVKGVRGPAGERVRLDALRIGGRWVTSASALQRFAEALTPQLDGGATPATPTQRQRAAERAGKELEALGI